MSHHYGRVRHPAVHATAMRLGLALFLLPLTLELVQGGEYVLGSGDAVEIRVGDEPSLSGEFKVSKEGTIVYPLLGAVPVGGLSVSNVARVVREGLAKDYLVNPQVAAYVTTYGSKIVSIFGDVLANPGIHALKEDSTLLTLLAEAGFKATDADVSVNIRRRASSGSAKGSEEAPPVVISLSDLTSPRKGAEPVTLRDGDQLFVSVKSVSVYGDVLTAPGVYPLRVDSTILTLLSKAGLKSAETDVTIIIRRHRAVGVGEDSAVEPPPTVVALSDLVSAWDNGEPFPLQDGDHLFVVAKVRGKVVVSGRVKKPGSIPLTEGLCVWEAVNSVGGSAEFGDLSSVRVIREEQGNSNVIKVDLTAVEKGIRSKDIPLKDGDIVVVPRRWF